MHRHEELGPRQGQHQLVVLLETVTRHVNAFPLAIDHLGAKHHQLVDSVDNRDRVSRNRAGRKDDRVTGLHLHLGMFAPGDAAEGSQGLPLAAGHQQQGFAVGQITNLLDRHEQFIGGSHVAQFACLGDHIEHGAAQQAHLATILERQFQDHRDPMDRAGEGGDDHPTLRLGDMAIQVGEHGTLGRTEARQLSVGGVTEQTQHTLLAVMGKAGDVEVLAIDRGVVELEVAGENNHASRSGDRQRVAVGHRVGVADELHREVLTHLHHLAGGDGLEDGAVHHARFLHLASENREGEARPVDDRNIEILEVVGNATDVIFMPVGHDHAADPFLVLAQVAGVGQNHIHAVHAIAGEGQTAIHQHQVIAVFEDAGVLADFVEAAEGDHPEGGLAFALAVGAGVGFVRIAHVGTGERKFDLNCGWIGIGPVWDRPEGDRWCGTGEDRRAVGSRGVKWDAGRPELRRGVHARCCRRKEGEDGEHPPASRRAPRRP